MCKPANLYIHESLVVKHQDGFDIVTYFEDDLTSPLDMGLDESDVEEINNGDVSWLIMIVKAYKNGIELGSDSIGGRAYRWREIDSILTDGYYNDLIYNAVNEAQSNILKLCEGVKQND